MDLDYYLEHKNMNHKFYPQSLVKGKLIDLYYDDPISACGFVTTQQ